MPSPVLTFLLATALTGPADEPPGRTVVLLTASDLVRPATIPPTRPGISRVWAWSSGEAGWTLATEAGRAVIRPVAGTDRGGPAWRPIGSLTRTTPDPTPIEVVAIGPSEKDKPAPIPLPALVAITADDATAADLAGPLDLVRGRIDTTRPTDDPRRRTSRTRDEGIDFQPPTTRQAWLDRAETLRTQLRVTLGLVPALPKTDLNAEVFGRLDRDGYTIEKVSLETLPGFRLAGNLYRPKGKAGRVPLVLCPHGHWKDGRTNVDVQARCVWWAKRLGCVVFLYDMVGFADSESFGHAFLDDRLRRWGLSLATLQTWNSLRALDWATTLPDVDPTRVGCTGESGGGTQTFLLAALDPRVKVAAPVVMVSHKMQGGCACENCAGLRIGTDNVEIAALIAPRPIKLVGADDWTDETMSVEYPAIRKVYALVGAPDRISADKFDFPHNYNRTTREAVYAFMGRWLAGIEDASAYQEGAITPEDAATLRVFDAGHPAPPGLKTPAQLEAMLVETLDRGLDRLAPGSIAVSWDASRRTLRDVLSVRVGLAEPPASDLTTATIRRSRRDGLTVDHLEVARSSTGDRVPVVRIGPEASRGRAVVVATGRGKADLVGPDGAPSALVRTLVGRGLVVIGYDPLLVGESIDPADPRMSRPEVAHVDTYNRSLAADRAQDLATVLGWAKTRAEFRSVDLIALGEAGPLALLARPMLAGLGRTAIDLDRLDPGDGSTPVPPGVDLPGLLQFGGLPAASALVAPDPLWLGSAPAGFARAWPSRSYDLADAAGMLRVDDPPFDPPRLARWIDTGEW